MVIFASKEIRILHCSQYCSIVDLNGTRITSVSNLCSTSSFFRISGSPDILICGNCREMFSDLIDMLDHKRDYCKLRFTCKCDVLNEECTSCDLSTSELMNINCNQGSQGDTNSGGDASINMSSSSRNLTSEATTINSPTSLSGKGNQE